MADLLVLPRPVKKYTMTQDSAEKLEHTGPAKKERVASVSQSEPLESTPEPPLPKEQSRLSTTPDRKGG